MSTDPISDDTEINQANKDEKLQIVAYTLHTSAPLSANKISTKINEVH